MIKQKLISALAAVSLALAGLLGGDAVHAAETITYFHNDISGSPMLATDTSGNLVWKENYRPYGDKLNNQAGSADNKLWFAGKPYDNNTGLSYMGARYYDPVIGRFMGMDPKGFDPDNVHSFNRYTYANNNPYRYVDPDGHQAVENWLGKDAPIVVIGNSFGALAAYAVGAASGNESLKNVALQGMAENRQANIEAVGLLATMGRGAKTPATEGGGAKLGNISPSDALRIQNAANRTGTEISVVGSRASGKSGPNSDWDFVVPNGTSKSVGHSLKSSLPEGSRGIGEPRNQDIHRGSVDTTKPHITFTPNAP